MLLEVISSLILWYSGKQRLHTACCYLFVLHKKHLYINNIFGFLLIKVMREGCIHKKLSFPHFFCLSGKLSLFIFFLLGGGVAMVYFKLTSESRLRLLAVITLYYIQVFLLFLFQSFMYYYI